MRWSLPSGFPLGWGVLLGCARNLGQRLGNKQREPLTWRWWPPVVLLVRGLGLAFLTLMLGLTRLWAFLVLLNGGIRN
jgi:hypothetical protein